MAVVLYTVQSRIVQSRIRGQTVCTWTRSLFCQDQLKCGMCSSIISLHAVSALNHRWMLQWGKQFSSMVGQRQIFLPPIPRDVCLLMSSSKFKNPTFVLELSQLQHHTAAIFLRTIWNAVSIKCEIFASKVLSTVSDDGSNMAKAIQLRHDWMIIMGSSRLHKRVTNNTIIANRWHF